VRTFAADAPVRRLPIARPPSARRAPWRARSPLEDGEVLRVTAFGNIIPVLAADITWRGASGTVIGEEGAYPSQSKTASNGPQEPRIER
jgi:hypothetical protein